MILPSVLSGSLVVNLTVFGPPTKLPWWKKAEESIYLQRWPMVNSNAKHNLWKERYISVFKANNFSPPKGQNIHYLLRTAAKNCSVCVDIGLTYLSIFPRVVKTSPIRWSLATGSPTVTDFHHNASLAPSVSDSACLGGNFWHMLTWWEWIDFCL